MSLSLTEINQALKPYQREVRQQYKLEQNISALQHQLASHQENLKYLDQALAKEWDDVIELTESRWRNFWLSLQLQGTKDVLLEKEQKEWEVVRDERQNLISLIAQVEEQIKILESKKQYLGEVSTPLAELLKTKHQILMTSETHDVYQQMVGDEEDLKKETFALENLVRGFQTTIDNLQKVEVLLQDKKLWQKNPQSVIHFIDTTYLLLNKLVSSINKQRLDLDLPFSIQTLGTFETQLNIAVNPQDWYDVLLTFEGYCQQILTQLQSKETETDIYLSSLHERRQKFLFESY